MSNEQRDFQMIFDEFCYYNPNMVDGVIDWYPSGHMEITIKLENEDKYIYDYISKVTRLLCNSYMDYSNPNYTSEQEFVERFSWRLLKKIKASGLTGAEVADKAKITPAQLSKYTTGKSIPNSYTLYKLSTVLNCAPSDLLWMR